MSAGWRIRHTDVHCHLFPGEICHKLGEGFGITPGCHRQFNSSQLTTGGQLISTDCNSLKEKNPTDSQSKFHCFMGRYKEIYRLNTRPLSSPAIQ